MEYQLEPNDLHVQAYSKMWLKNCSICNGVRATEKYVRLEHPPWSRTEYECINCGNQLYEKCWTDVLAEYGDMDDD